MKAKYAVLVGLMASSSLAHSFVVTVEDNIADNTYIQHPDSIVGQFDINAALPADGSYNAPYDITSATANYSFTDDGELNKLNTVYTSYAWESSNWGDDYYYRSKTDYYVDDNEEVQVSTSFESSSDGTDWYEAVTQTGTNYDSSSCGWDCNYYYTRTYDDVEGYTGQFVIEQVFDADSIGDLAADGVVDFTISATAGDIIFNQGLLTVNLESNPVAVPAPAGIALFGLGMLTLGLSRRRAAKKS